MAPTITAASYQDDLSLNHKLRKPLVEKLRRERINSSIEQLKSLLGPEFLKQQPDSKLEKADILEMTVCFLTQLLKQNQNQRRLLTRFDEPGAAPDQRLTAAELFSVQSKDNAAVWRPW